MIVVTGYIGAVMSNLVPGAGGEDEPKLPPALSGIDIWKRLLQKEIFAA